jgi:protein-tyrosine phosphatase
MTFLPGKQYLSTWSGAWWRDLDADVARLRTEFGADLFLLLVEDHELDLLEVPHLAAEVERAGMELIRFPIADVSVPDDPEAVASLLATIRGRLDAGQRVLVACRGGLGRTGTVVGCLLREAGLDGDAAVALTRTTRHGTIETWRQEAFVRDWMPRCQGDSVEPC